MQNNLNQMLSGALPEFPIAESRATDSTNVDQDEGQQSRGIKCHPANYFFSMQTDNKSCEHTAARRGLHATAMS